MTASIQELSFSGVVLAGGYSSRMGREKALLPVDGQPLWRRQYDLLAQAGAKECYVSVRKEQDWLPDDVARVDDSVVDCGPLSGLAAVTLWVKRTHLIVLAVDLPELPLQWLTRLQASCLYGLGAVGLHEEEGFEPLAAIYPAEMFPFIRACLSSRDLSMQSMLRRATASGLMRALPIKKEEERWFENWNTPEQITE